jgi:1-acyl-sn-glycerol-3-phosphate acyltransferase
MEAIMQKGNYLKQHHAPSPTVNKLRHENIFMWKARLLIYMLYRKYLCRYNQLCVLGQEHLFHKSPFIIAPNHSSHLDTPSVFAVLPTHMVKKTFSAAAKDYFFTGPCRSLAARLLTNAIPVGRTGDALSGFRLCVRKLRSGNNIIIFPEGTRTHCNRIGNFKPGVIALSRFGKVPVVPVYIDGTRESMPRGRYVPKGTRITVVFGKPICFWGNNFQGYSHKEAAMWLADHVRMLKEKLHKKEQRNGCYKKSKNRCFDGLNPHCR